jgi:hypothetical protein
MSTVIQNKRYPGVKPFETTERALFFGRDKDIEDLLDLVWLEKLVVLFGKSGYGKSSLINAGILPEIEKEAVPIVVRLGSYIAGQNPSPLDNLKRKIDEVLSDNSEANFIQSLNVPKTLWHQMKNKQSRRQRRFVLIFDQFEEFFTYPITEQQAFKEQIADLLYTEVPQAVRDLNDTLTDAQQAFIATPFDAKVLFAIRADRMSLLDSMKDKLPAILQKRYELRGLSLDQAKEAIKNPAEKEGDFASPKFTYSDEALRVMTQKLSETKVSQRTGIEAFQLQILCEYLEDKIIKGEIQNNRIEPAHFADKINDIYEGYYERLIEKLDPSLQKAAQLLIEEKLIFEDTQTGEARRLSVDSGVLLNEKGITQSLLNQLESTFLLRRESTSTGGFNYEVSHDTMIAPILKEKAERKALEKAEAERLEAQRKQRRLIGIIVAAGVALALVIGAVLYVLKLRNDAVAALAIAEREKAKAEKNYNDLISAQNAKEITEFKITLQDIKKTMIGGNKPPSEYLKKMREIKDKYPNEIELQNLIQDIENQLLNR